MAFCQFGGLLGTFCPQKILYILFISFLTALEFQLPISLRENLGGSSYFLHPQPWTGQVLDVICESSFAGQVPSGFLPQEGESSGTFCP